MDIRVEILLEDGSHYLYQLDSFNDIQESGRKYIIQDVETGKNEHKKEDVRMIKIMAMNKNSKYV